MRVSGRASACASRTRQLGRRPRTRPNMSTITPCCQCRGIAMLELSATTPRNCRRPRMPICGAFAFVRPAGSTSLDVAGRLGAVPRGNSRVMDAPLRVCPDTTSLRPAEPAGCCAPGQPHSGAIHSAVTRRWRQQRQGCCLGCSSSVSRGPCGHTRAWRFSLLVNSTRMLAGCGSDEGVRSHRPRECWTVELIFRPISKRYVSAFR